MLARMIEISRLLVSARQSKLGGGMQWVELQRVLESFNRLRKLPGLHVRCPKKIPCVSIVRIDFNYMLKRINRRLRIASIFCQQPKVVPCVRNLCILLDRIFECSFGLIDFLQIQKRDAFVQARHRQLRIKLRRLAKGFESLLEQLLVHVGRAQIVHPRGFDGIRLQWSLRRGGKKTKCGEQHASKSN